MASLQHLRCGKSLAHCGCNWSGDEECRTRAYVTDPLSGRRRLVSRSFQAKGKRAAEREHNRVAVELEAEAKRTAKHGASFAGLIDDWMTIKRRDRSPSTLRAYERHTKRITKQFGHLPAEEVTGQMIDRWYTQLIEGGMSAQNVNHVHRVLRAICRFGYKKRGLPVCATDHATPPPEVEYEVQPPTPAAVAALLSGVSGEWGRAVELLARTGLRRGEVVGLRWSDIAEDHMTVRHSIVEIKGGGVDVRPPKGKRTRVVTLTPAAREVLDRQQRWQAGVVSSPWVFAELAESNGRQPKRPGWVSLMWGRYMTKLVESGALAKEHRIRLHDLRHAHATTLLDAGVPLNTVQAELGHARASTTSDIYGHSGDRGRLMVAEVLQASLPALECKTAE